MPWSADFAELAKWYGIKSSGPNRAIHSACLSQDFADYHAIREHFPWRDMACLREVDRGTAAGGESPAWKASSCPWFLGDYDPSVMTLYQMGLPESLAPGPLHTNGNALSSTWWCIEKFQSEAIKDAILADSERVVRAGSYREHWKFSDYAHAFVKFDTAIIVALEQNNGEMVPESKMICLYARDAAKLLSMNQDTIDLDPENGPRLTLVLMSFCMLTVEYKDRGIFDNELTKTMYFEDILSGRMAARFNKSSLLDSNESTGEMGWDLERAGTKSFTSMRDRAAASAEVFVRREIVIEKQDAMHGMGRSRCSLAQHQSTMGKELQTNPLSQHSVTIPAHLLEIPKFKAWIDQMILDQLPSGLQSKMTDEGLTFFSNHPDGTERKPMFKQADIGPVPSIICERTSTVVYNAFGPIIAYATTTSTTTKRWDVQAKCWSEPSNKTLPAIVKRCSVNQMVAETRKLQRWQQLPLLTIVPQSVAKAAEKLIEVAFAISEADPSLLRGLQNRDACTTNEVDATLSELEDEKMQRRLKALLKAQQQEAASKAAAATKATKKREREAQREAKAARKAAKQSAATDKKELACELQEVCKAVTLQAIQVLWTDGILYGATVHEFTAATKASIEYHDSGELESVDLWSMVTNGTIQFVDQELNAWVGYLLYCKAVEEDGPDFACWSVAEEPDDCTYEEDVIQVTDAASNADEDTDGGTNSDEEMPFQL